MSETRMTADWISGERSPPGLQVATFLLASHGRDLALPLLIRALIPLGGPTLVASSNNPHYLPRPHLHIAPILEVRAST